MADFATRIEDIIGSVGDSQLVSDSLTDAAKNILNLLPYQCQWLISVETPEITSNGYGLIDSCRILHVVRENGVEGQYEVCKEALPGFQGSFTNINSIFYPSGNNPIFFRKDGKIYVYPAPSSTPDTFKVSYILFPTVLSTDTVIRTSSAAFTGVICASADAVFTTSGAHGLSVGDSISLSDFLQVSDDEPYDLINGITTQVATTPLTTTFTLEGINSNSIAVDLDSGTATRVGQGFPSELEHVVVLGGAIKCRLRQLTDKRATISSSIPSTITLDTAPSAASMDTSLAIAPSSFSYTPPSVPTAPGAAVYSYTKPILLLDGIPTISDLDLSSIIAPIEPNAPVFSYAKPTVAIDDIPTIGDLDLSGVTAPVAPISPSITYSDASNTDGSAASVASVIVGAVDNITGVADISFGPTPTYDNLYGNSDFDIEDIPTINDLDLSDITPPPPPSAPDFTYSDASGGDASQTDASANLAIGPTVGSATAGDTSFGSLPSAPTYVKPTISNDVQSSITSAITTDEDVELAQAYIAQFQASCQEYSIDIQNAQNDFNKDMAVYQAELKKQEADLREESSKLQAQAQMDSAKVLKQAETDLTVALQNAKAETEISIRNKAEARANDEFNKQQTQALSIINKGKALEGSIQVYDAELKKYDGDLKSYREQINKKVTEYKTNEIEKELASWERYNEQKIKRFGIAIQDELNSFNKDNVIYQAEFQGEVEEMRTALASAQANIQKNIQQVQKQADMDLQGAIKDADYETQVSLANKAQDQLLDLQNKAKELEALIADWEADIQKYQQETQAYQIEINKAVQEYTINEIQKEMVGWQQYNSTKIQEYGQDIQNELNEYNGEVAEYNASLQKYSADLGRYTAKINTAVQEYTTNEMQKEIALWDGFNKQKLQQYSQDLQNELNEFNQDVAEYQANLGLYQAELQQYQTEIGSATATFQVDVQKHTSELNEAVQLNQSKLADYSAKIQSWQAQQGQYLQKYQFEVATYQTETAAVLQVHATMLAELKELREQYNMCLQAFISQYSQQQQGEA